MNLKGLEKLAVDHAHWADRVRHLKQKGYEESSKCPNTSNGNNCIEAAYYECRSMNAEAPYDDGYSFEEVWEEAIAGGKVCEHCQAVRKLRAERMEASRRLGAVRSALTRVGRGLSKQGGEA